MSKNLIGVDAIGGDILDVLARIDRLESLGIDAAWVSDGQIEFDALSLLAAAAERTERIALGTGIVRTWPRHPLVTVQQSLTLAKLAPGRTRLGVGPAHRDSMQEEFGFDFKAPLSICRSPGRCSTKAKWISMDATITSIRAARKPPSTYQ